MSSVNKKSGWGKSSRLNEKEHLLFPFDFDDKLSARYDLINEHLKEEPTYKARKRQDEMIERAMAMLEEDGEELYDFDGE